MTISREEIARKLKDNLIQSDDRNKDKYEAATEASNLSTDLGLMSIDMLYLVITIEEEFDIEFGDVGVSDFKTLGDVVSFIEDKLNNK